MLQMQLKEVGIDYPQSGEKIVPGPYSLRVTAPTDAKEVRISIDDGEWNPCRTADGHWWLDLNNSAPGEHVAVARVIETDGSLIISQPRLFQVQPS